MIQAKLSPFKYKDVVVNVNRIICGDFQALFPSLYLTILKMSALTVSMLNLINTQKESKR